MKKDVIIWGAGKIGRGFIPDLLNEDVFQITFVDKSKVLVEELKKRKEYQIINAIDNNTISKIPIKNYAVFSTDQKKEIQNVFTRCSYVFVIVYPKYFKDVAADLSKHILQRREEIGPEPLDIILCTNLIHAGNEFNKSLYQNLSLDEKKYFSEKVGVVETLVIRICADPNDAIKKEDPLAIVTNGYPKLLVVTKSFRGEIPLIESFKSIDDLEIEEKKKLFTYNMFQAVLAYFGSMAGFELIPECFGDDQIVKISTGALEESRRALVKEFNLSSSEMKIWCENVIRQTNNAIVGDTVFRYAADPIRKLQKEDRLIGPALLCIKNGIHPQNIINGIAAGLVFYDQNDPKSVELQKIISQIGPRETIKEICGLTENNASLIDDILLVYSQLCSKHTD